MRVRFEREASRRYVKRRRERLQFEEEDAESEASV
jgi:hypothetical protein